LSLEFEWNAKKAKANETKHGISFVEAATVFADPLSLTIDDPDHSDKEDRFIIVGLSSAKRLLVVVHVERGDRIRIIGARLATPRERGRMKKPKPKKTADHMRDEYDFSGGVRGKLAKRFVGGANVVVLDPDVAKAFPDSAAVNEALRALLDTKRKKRAQ
jgi:uncharacterized protein